MNQCEHLEKLGVPVQLLSVIENTRWSSDRGGERRGEEGGEQQWRGVEEEGRRRGGEVIISSSQERSEFVIIQDVT